MINANEFLSYLMEQQIEFFTGVPDSQLKAICEEIYARFGADTDRHIVAVNEGNAVGLAAGHHLATGKVALVYLQNSGLGNAVNPITSLADPAVYGIPVLYLVGWRGEPGVHDEPQHVKQGAITLPLLELLGIEHAVLSKDSTLEEVEGIFEERFKLLFAQGKSAAFVVRKGAFAPSGATMTSNHHTLGREEAIVELASKMGPDDYIVSTTGKISRELFEYCKRHNPELSSHNFLTVGSMGHASAIACFIALRHPDKTVWCLDGDGAVLMHMGSLSTIGTMGPRNFVHIVLNNEAHESVGSMPTVAGRIDLASIATSCGYASTETVSGIDELRAVDVNDRAKPCMIQVMVNTASREDLMRPDTTPIQNKRSFMEALDR